MNVTVCIPTRNRPDDLAECLDSIAASAVPVGEIVVSDDSTDDRTRDLVAARYPHVKYVFGPRKGLGPNRNSAIAAASGEWILFLDDDARLGPDFLAEMVKALYANPDRKLIFTGIEKQVKGLVFPNDQDFLGFQKRPYGSRRSVNTVVINATLFPAALFKEMLFDPRLIYGYDEVDIASCARGAGYRIVLIPSAVNLHFPSPVNRDYYSPHTEAARIYVTFKRYTRAERRPLKALAFLALSFIHSLAYHMRRQGFAGVSGAFKMHGAALNNIALWLAEGSRGRALPDLACAPPAQPQRLRK
jgi:GT2 family glycosyltransferase